MSVPLLTHIKDLPYIGAEHDRQIIELAETQLRHCRSAFKNICCSYRDGVLTVSGDLPTFYLKQLAQATVARLEGIERVDNRVRVES